MNSISKSTQIRKELVSWINNIQPDYFLTLSFNESASKPNYDYNLKRLGYFYAAMDRQLLGRQWAKPKHAQHRPLSVAFLEKSSTNPHWHILVKPVHNAPYRCDYSSLVNANWRKICPSGTTDIKPISAEYDRKKVAEYVTKELEIKCWDNMHFVISTEFTSS